MANLKTRTVLVYDLGLFGHGLCQELIKSFGKVYYCCPCGVESPFPRSNALLIGKGWPEVERVDEIWGVLDDIDLFVFTDVGSGKLQEHLRHLGKRVWGAGTSDWLELDRVKSKKELEKLGVPIGEWKKLVGMDALRKHLAANNDQWVKTSRYRGDFETFPARNLNLVDSVLDDLAHRLGAKKNIMEFVVEKDIKNAVEIAYDGYTIDGKFPSKSLCGAEIKDKGYVGRFKDYDDLPKQILETNEAISGILEKEKCRSFIGMEMRIDKKGTPWVIDPLTRFGSPPGELCQVIYKNLADILWAGGNGEMVDPEPVDEWGVELLLHSQWANSHWQAIDIPKEIVPFVKLRNACTIDGKHYIVPQTSELPEVGAVVATGPTMEAAIEQCKEYAEALDKANYPIELYTESLEEASSQLEKLASYGVKI